MYKFSPLVVGRLCKIIRQSKFTQCTLKAEGQNYVGKNLTNELEVAKVGLPDIFSRYFFSTLPVDKPSYFFNVFEKAKLNIVFQGIWYLLL